MWELYFTKQAQKDAKKIKQAGLKGNTEILLEVLKEDPFKSPPSYKKLIGDLSGAYSRRINIQHRLVYQVYTEQRKIKVLRMWSHYE
jgi:toxin YoeB